MSERDIGQQQAEIAIAAMKAAENQRPINGQATNLTLPEQPPSLRTIGQQQEEVGAHSEDKTTPSKN